MNVVHTCSLAQLCLALSDTVGCSPPAPLSTGFFRQEYWSGLPSPPPGEHPNPGIKPTSLCLLHWQVGSLPSEPNPPNSDGLRIQTLELSSVSFFSFLSFFIFWIALLSYNSYSIQFNHLKCTIQWLSVYLQNYSMLTIINFRTLSFPSKETPCPLVFTIYLAFHPPIPNPRQPLPLQICLLWMYENLYFHIIVS